MKLKSLAECVGQDINWRVESVNKLYSGKLIIHGGCYGIQPKGQPVQSSYLICSKNCEHNVRINEANELIILDESPMGALK